MIMNKKLPLSLMLTLLWGCSLSDEPPDKEEAEEAFRISSYKLPIKTRIVVRRELGI